jgi:hypothetical protein
VSIRKRTLAAAAGLAFVATAAITPAALAGGDSDHDGNGRRAQPSVPADPTTCTDGLLTLVKVRTDANRLGATVTVAERQDAAAQDALRKAQAGLADAKAVEAGTKAKLATAKIELDKVKAEPVATPGHAGRLVAAQNAYDNAYKAYADAQADTAKADAALIKARQDAEAKRSYLAELRVKQTNEGNLVARLTLLVDRLCQKPVPVPTPEPTTEQPPPPVDTTPPVDNTPPPVIVNQPQTQIINNPAIGQVPTGSNTGGGSEAATVE